MKNDKYVYWPDILIVILCVAIVLGITYFTASCNNVVEAVENEIEVYSEEIEEEPEVQYFDVPLSPELQDYIFEVCDRYSIDPAVIVTMIERESQFNESAVGDNGKSFGLMQIQKRWHGERMERLGVTDLLDSKQNILVGTDYLHELLGEMKGMTWALMAYNGGPSYANTMYKNGMVSDYAREIITLSNQRSFYL